MPAPRLRCTNHVGSEPGRARLSSATQVSRTASRSGTGRPSMLPSVRATVLAPASGTRSRRHQQSNGSPSTTSRRYGGSSSIDLAEPAGHDQQGLERLDRQRLDRERGDVVGQPPARAGHRTGRDAAAPASARSPGAAGRRGRRRDRGRRRVGQRGVERDVQPLHRRGRGRRPAGAVGVEVHGARRRRAARSSSSRRAGRDAQHRVRIVSHPTRRASRLAAPDPVVDERRRAACGAAGRGARPARRA